MYHPPPLTKLRQSQRKANLGILNDKVHPVDGPARNTRSQTQVRTITQEDLLSCIHNYGKAMSHPVTAHRTAQQQYPTNMIHTVLDKTTGHIMEMWHLLVNPKCKELWGESYTKELRHLAQGMSGVSKGTNTIVFMHRKDIPHNCNHNVTYAHVSVNYRPFEGTERNSRTFY
jgi:hypothetical protein